MQFDYIIFNMQTFVKISSDHGPTLKLDLVKVA